MDSYQDRSGTTSVIHVLIANLTGMIAEMVQQTCQQQPDISLSGTIKKWEDIDASIAETDVLVLGVDDVYSPPQDCFRFLSNHPNLKILLLTTTGDEAIVYWQTLHCHQTQITSSQSLIKSIRHVYSLSP